MGIFVTMRILYIGNKLSKSGGINPTSIETLGEQLKDIGCEMKYASSVKNQWLRWLDMARSVVLNRKWAELVLIDTYSSKAFYFSWMVAQVCRFFKIPYFPILRGGNLKERIKSHPRLAKQVFQYAEKNIGVSDFFKSTFEELGYPFLMIPNNIPVQEYTYLCREKAYPQILWVRSFHQIYNPLLALDILKLVQDFYPNAKLAMVGPEKDESQKEFMAYSTQLGLSNSVVITGRKTKQEWRELSKDYSIFLSTTNIDNTPISVIEAMALGLPVVSTDVGGVPFIIQSGQNGILYPAKDAQAGANAILSILNDSTLSQNLSSNGRKTVEEWDWEVVKMKWKNLFESTLQKRNS